MPVSSCIILRVNFSHQHSQDSIVILEEGNQPHPRCLQFEIFFPQEALNWVTSDMCWHGSKKEQRIMVVAEVEKCMGGGFSAYGKLLMEVPPFKYLGRILLSSNDD